VHIVWEEETDVYSYDLVKYRKFDYAAGEWGVITTLPADEEEIEKYGMPVIISDVYDNLHVLMTGERVGAGINDEEVYYSYWDAPPHIWDLTFLQSQSNQDSVVISWTGWGERDLDTYKIYRKYLGQSWEYVNSTTDTRYSDTESSYSQGGFSEIDYYVEAVDDASQSTYSDTIAVAGTEQNKLNSGGYSIIRFELRGNYPNPFNAQTTIEFNLPFETEVRIEIYDILGRIIETLLSDRRPAGLNQVTWDASRIASGMYFYRIRAGEYSTTKRMSVIK
jgi:hypothetical protein